MKNKEQKLYDPEVTAGKLQYFRRLNGMTVEQLAEQLCYSVGSVYCHLSGYKITLGALNRYCVIFGIDFYELL